MDQTITKQPIISVIMPVNNGERYIREAIESVESQTFQDWELVIYNDGSTDSTSRIISEKSAGNPKIIVIESYECKGQSTARNEAIKIARGKYLALLDADDIALPKRLEIQRNFMEKNPEISVVGSWAIMRSETSGFIYKTETEPTVIAAGFLFHTMIVNSSVIIRSEFLKKFELSYDTHSAFLAEDYTLWTKCARYGLISNIPEVLVIYRIHPSSISSERKQDLTRKALVVREDVLKNLGIFPSQEDMRIHSGVKLETEDSYHFIQKELTWLKKIAIINKSSQIYETNALRYILEKQWYHLCKTNLSGQVLRIFISNPFEKNFRHVYLLLKLSYFLLKNPQIS